MKTKYYFEHLKIHELLIDYISQDQDTNKKKEDETNKLKQKIKIKLKSGVYPHVISLDHIIENGKCDLVTSLKYIIEVLLAIQYMHTFRRYKINIPRNFNWRMCKTDRF